MHAQGLTDLDDQIGAFTFVLNTFKLRDMRASQGGKFTQIGRHASRILKSKLGSNGLEKVVSDIHASYGDAETVLFSQPPRAEIPQRVQRHAEAPAALAPEFMIVRAASIRLKRVGSYRVQK